MSVSSYKPKAKKGQGTRFDPLVLDDLPPFKPSKKKSKKRYRSKKPSKTITKIEKSHAFPKTMEEELRLLEEILYYSQQEPKRITRLDAASLKQCPTIYWTDEDAACRSNSINDGVCFVCLEELNPGQIMRICRRCKPATVQHVFHKDCLDWWFDIGSQCPICKISQSIS